MIASVFSPYKDILALVPVKNLNAEYLFQLVCKALYILQEMGFTLLTLISGNNTINRNVLKISSISTVNFSK